jgi:predicted PurR-regulated permease PerM
LKPEQQNRKYFTIAIYAMIVLLVGIGVVFLLWNFDSVKIYISKISDICSPIMYGALIAYILNPLMKIFEEKVFKNKKAEEGLSRTARRIVSVVMTFLSFFILLALFVWMILPQLSNSIKDLGEKFPMYLQSVEDLAHSIAASGGALATAIESLLTTINEFIDNSYDLLKQYLPVITSMLQSVALGALDIVLGIVFSIYFLMAKESIAAQTKKFLRAIFKETTYENILRIVSLTDNTFGKYFTGAILDSLLVGIVCFILMTVLGLPYAPLISVVIGVTNVIPYFGPFIGSIPSAIILFVANPIYAVYFIVMILVLQQIDGNIIAPRIHSSSTGLAPVWVIVAVTLMSGILGFIGMFIGVPLFSVIYTLIKEQVEKRLEKKSLPLETVDYMSEMGRAYCEKPEKEKKPWKEKWKAMLVKAPKKQKNTPIEKKKKK